jgi:ABC-2 type transport system permease protein
MANVWTIARRELKYFFAGPVAYVLAFFLLAALGVYFYLVVLFSNQPLQGSEPPDVQVITGLLVFLLVFITPAVTMRSISEENRLGTLELMLTAPVKDWEFVVGKWLGGFLFLFILIAATWIYPLILNNIVQPGIDQGPLISGYLGVVLLTAAFLALGVMVSSFVPSQVAAFLLTFAVLFLFWWLMNIIGQVVGPPASTFFNYMDLSSHVYDNLLTGVIDLADVIYLTTVTVVSLVIGTVSVEMRRWR